MPDCHLVICFGFEKMRKLFDLPVRNELTDKSYNLSSFLIVDEFTNDEAKVSDVLKSRSNQ